MSRVALMRRVALSICVGLPTSVHAGYTFSPAFTIPLEGIPTGLARADFNRDGLTDLAVVISNPAVDSDRVVVYFRTNSAEGYARGPVTILPGGGKPGQLIAANLDGDASPDLALALEDAEKVLVLLNKGDGRFLLASEIATGKLPRGLAAGDLNGDLQNDIVVANGIGNTLTMAINNGNGKFPGVTTLMAGRGPKDIAIADFDRDGDNDLLVSNEGEVALGFYRNTAGSLDLEEGLGTGPVENPGGVAVGDFNKDGYADFAVASMVGEQEGVEGAVVVFLNTRDGMFMPYGSFMADTPTPGDLAAADFDGDGDLEIVVTTADPGLVIPMTNNGRADFRIARPLEAGKGARNPLVGDFDSNGTMDVAVINPGSRSISIFTTCFGDMSGNRVADFEDLNIILNQFGLTGENLKGDVDNDGEVDMVDMNILLGSFGLTCF